MKNGTKAKGQPMKPAYEDIHLALQSILAQELMSCSLEKELGLLTDWGDGKAMEIDSECPLDVKALLHARHPENFLGAVLDIGAREAPRPGKYYATIKSMAANDAVTTEGMTDGAPRLLQELESQKPRIMEERYEQISSQQVSRNKIEFAPSWIIDEAFRSEL